MSRRRCKPLWSDWLWHGKPRLALGQIRARVASDAGPLETLATCLFHWQPEGWRLLMFHNTEISRY